jgi:hypothetical protein
VSRRHHGGRPHRSNGHVRPFEAPRAPAATGLNGFDPHAAHSAPPPGPESIARGEADTGSEVARAVGGVPAQPEASATIADRVPAEDRPAGDREPGATCTAPQLRRFIKSRPYVPMHELRRRFGINGGEDDVTPVELVGGRVFVGLPQREGALLGELLRGGEIGYELSLDPRSPVVVGLYPMRPVART